jgi:YD repeat-containing protein
MAISASVYAGTVSYTYDDLGRVKVATYPDGSVVSYSYDAAGNRITRGATIPAPSAGNVSLSTPYNTPGTVALAPSGRYSSLAVAAGPSHGSASISGSNATYTPNSGYYGSDSFTYTATGPGGTSSAATISVSVGNPAAPTANGASINTAYNTAGSTSLSIGGVYSSTALASGAAHGTASVSGTTASYTPNSGYYGSDSFTYTASGPGGTSSPATVSVNIATPSAPSAGNASINIGYNTAGSTSLSISGVYSSTALATGASHGTASISGTTASYTPNSGYYGPDSFTYTASGPGGTSAPATVTVSVATPGTPVPGNASISTAYNTAGSTSLSISGVYSSTALATGASHGTASVSGATASYIPNSGYYGSDSFTYTATGPGGTSSPATVSVSVATPAAPTVGNASLTVNYNTAGSVGLSPSGVYSSLAVASGPSHGSASISGTTATYTPTSGYSGLDSFAYTATGPGGTSSPATVSVTVQPNPIVTINVTSASNLRTLANNNGYNGASGVQYQFVVPSGTTIEGSSGGGAAIDTGTWPSGVTLSMVVSGNVYGGGGNGGNGSCSNLNAGSGGQGGDAVYIQAPISVTVNAGGSIQAGGGGGGGAGDYGVSNGHGGSAGSCGAGGGGGFPDGSGGLGSSSTSGLSAGSNGAPGTTSGGGAGGSTGLPGGAGGNAATAGGQGATGNSPGVGGPGGSPGYAIRFNGNAVTVNNSGTITGTQG